MSCDRGSCVSVHSSKVFVFTRPTAETTTLRFETSPQIKAFKESLRFQWKRLAFTVLAF